MNERYAHGQPSSFIEKEKPKNIVNDLTLLIKTKKDRRTMEEGSRVYKTQPKPKPNLLEIAMNKKIRELEEELRTRKGTGTGRMAQEKPKGKAAGASYNNLEEVPESPYKWPCHKCEIRTGTERDKKDYCTNKHHCRVHDGQFMCMKSQKCRDRTA